MPAPPEPVALDAAFPPSRGGVRRLARHLSALGKAGAVWLFAVAAAAGVETLVAAQTRAAPGPGQGLLAQHSPVALAMGVAAVAALVALFWAVTNRLLATCLGVGALLAVVAQAHVRKMQVLGKPLMPWDLLNWRQIAVLLGSLASVGDWLGLVAVALALALVGLVLVSRRPRWRLRPLARVALAVVAATWLAVLVGSRAPALEAGFKTLGVVNALWDQPANVRRNGLLLSVLMNARSMLVTRRGYSREAVLSAMQPYRRRAASPTGSAGEAPDVIVVMGEATWDPTVLPGVEFSRDPMPTLRRLAAQQHAGSLLSPVFGGGTANAEFEVLTGIPTAMLPDGTYPYQHYLERPLRALPWVMREHGYRAVAVHAFHRWYWSRHHAYPLLGFEEFVSLEQMEPVPREGPYPSDEPMVDHVLAQLERGRGQPTFVLAIGMVTHQPYDYPRSPTPEVTVRGAALSERSVHLLENYASALHRADRALARLLQALEKRERPTLLVFFGDHLPTLGVEKRIYRETGFVSGAEPSLEERVRMARTALCSWSNYPVPDWPAELGMSFLGPQILRAAGIEPEGYFAFVDDLSHEAPVILRDAVKAGGQWYGGLDDPALPQAVRSRIDLQHLLGYDRLLGSAYGMQPVGHALAGR